MLIFASSIFWFSHLEKFMCWVVSYSKIKLIPRFCTYWWEVGATSAFNIRLMLCPHGYLGNHRSHSRDNTCPLGDFIMHTIFLISLKIGQNLSIDEQVFFSVLSLFLLLLLSVFYAWYCFAEIRIKHRTLKGSDKTFRLGSTQEICPYPTSHF